MREHLHTPLTIDVLAAHVGLSASRLAYLFREGTRMSPSSYLQMLRLERARLLIESTDLAVGDVMRQVGLSDPSHFSRDFRNAYGLSPRGYRLQLRLTGSVPRYRNGEDGACRS